jgi:TPR repeat protein
MRKLHAPSGAIRLAIGVALIVFVTTVSAQTKPSELDSDELMKRMLELSGNVEKKSEIGSYLQELMNRAKARQPSALFNWGWYRYYLCGEGKKQGIDVSRAPLCTQALDDLKAVAENSKVSILYISPASMTILGEMYRDGIGIKPSRYLAADWFVKSAKQRNANGDREGAIRALEEALSVVPDYPAAIELRASMLKQ